MAKTRKQVLEEAIPTLANKSVGVLWNGEDGKFTHQPTDPKKLAEGAVPNAVDARVASLAGAVMEKECSEILMHKMPIDGLGIPEEIYAQLVEKMSKHMASVLRFARFHAEDGNDNIRVKIKETFVHGRTNMTDTNIISLLYTDVLCEKCPFDVVKKSYEVLCQVFEELGYYVQEHGTAGFLRENGVIDNEERSFRLSWYKPSLVSHRSDASDPSQVDAYRSGVPIEDIFA